MLLQPFGGTLIDVVNNTIWTPNGSIGNAFTAVGPAANHTGNNANFWQAVGYADMVGAAGTLFCWLPRVGLADTSGHVYLYTNTGNTVYWQAGPAGSAWVGAAGSITGSSTTGWYSTTMRSVVFASNGTTISVFVDGVQSGSSGTPTALSSGPKTLTIGKSTGGTNWDTDGDIAVIGYSARTWSVDDALAFHRNPWQLYAPDDRHRTFFGPPAGAPAGSVTLNDLTNLRIVQRNGTTGSATISGTVTGTVTSVEARVVTTGSLTPVTSWAVVDAAPTATWSGTITSIPEGDGYSIQVRPSNEPSGIVTGSATWGVGDFWFVIGQSNGRKFVSDGTGTPASTTRKYSGSAGTAWAANTGAASIAFANALTAAQGIPIAIGDYGLDGTALLQEADTVGYWLNTAANQPYAKFLAGINSVGGKCAGIIWDQGQKEGSLSGSVTKAEYKSGLQTLFARIRTDLGQPNLPMLIAPLGRYTGGSTDAAWQDVRDAQYEVAAEANNYLALQTYDVELAVDGVHYSTGSNGFLRYGTRVGLRAKEVLGLTTNSRGPYIVSASRINSTTIDVTFALRGGSTITPASGVTILRVVDDAGVNAIVSTTRLTATKMRVVVTSAMTGTVIVQAAYGVNPTVTGTIYDDSANTLPLEGTSAAGIAVTRKQATLTLVDRNNVPRANVSGIYGAWFDNPRLDQVVAPTDVFSGLSTDGSGVLTIDIPNSALSNGQIGRLQYDNSDGTLTQTPSPVGGGGPVAVTVV